MLKKSISDKLELKEKENQNSKLKSQNSSQQKGINQTHSFNEHSNKNKIAPTFQSYQSTLT